VAEQTDEQRAYETVGTLCIKNMAGVTGTAKALWSLGNGTSLCPLVDRSRVPNHVYVKSVSNIEVYQSYQN
jgi:hypothetical protein